jgi:DNA-binding transcriptional ArsR family regulator
LSVQEKLSEIMAEDTRIMDDLPEDYYIETIEQMRAIADELRMRIGSLLLSGPMTATQVAKALDMAPSKVHYHLGELERVGLVKLAYTRVRGNLIERYYVPVARNIKVSQSLISSSLDEVMEAAEGMLRHNISAFAQATRRAALLPEGSAIVDISNFVLWVTPEQYKELFMAIDALLRPYEAQRGIEGEREVAVHLNAYEPRLLDTPSEDAGKPAPGSARTKYAAGAMYLSRDDLEMAVAAGRKLDISAFGLLALDSAITPELADAALGSVRVKGIVRASPEVRAVIRRKGGTPSE